MSWEVIQVLGLGFRYRIHVLEEAHKWLFAVLGVVFAPLLLAIHLPVSLWLVGNESEVFYSGAFLALVHIFFAFAGERLSPPEEEVRWILMRAGVRGLFANFSLVHFKVNILYWALWLVPLLVLNHLGEKFSFADYVLSLCLYTLLYMISVLGFTLAKYRALLFSFPAAGIIAGQRFGRYRCYWISLGCIAFSYALLDAGQWIVVRSVLAVFASMLVAQGVNAILKCEAEVAFWMHAKSCGRAYLLLSATLKGLLLSLPAVIVVAQLLERESMLYSCVFMTAAMLLSPLSLSPIGRSLLAPLLAAVAVGLLCAAEDRIAG